MNSLFFKDKYIAPEEALIPINDRSFRFGDGVFETVLVSNSRIYEFDTHLERLKNGLKFFKINYDSSSIKEICEELIKKNKLETGYLRMIISRGENGPGAIGYMPKDTQAYLIVQVIEKDFPEFKSIKLWHSSYHAHFSAPSKINSSLHYTLSMIEADENKCDNALITKDDGTICETANGNLFWFKDGVLYTPSLDLPFVPGTVRKRILELYKGEVKEGHFHIDELKDADEVFMSNIGGLITQVSAIEPLGLSFFRNDKTKELREFLVDDILKL